ncbi:hypothetical protein PSAB6_230382 [Paraburkholderia sabiae]|nr:hypothetical protein PSAB6_230382 [Paraburkholderia sabiae]
MSRSRLDPTDGTHAHRDAVSLNRQIHAALSSFCPMVRDLSRA